MTAWSRSLFGVSIVFGVGTMMLGEKLPELWGPVSILAMVLAASAFLTCSVLEYRRRSAAVGFLEEQFPRSSSHRIETSATRPRR